MTPLMSLNFLIQNCSLFPIPFLIKHKFLSKSFTNFTLFASPHPDDNIVAETSIVASEPVSAVQHQNAAPELSLIPPLNHPTHTELSQSHSVPFQSNHPMITRANSRIYKPKTYLITTQDIELSSVKGALSNQKWCSTS